MSNVGFANVPAVASSLDAANMAVEQLLDHLNLDVEDPHADLNSHDHHTWQLFERLRARLLQARTELGYSNDLAIENVPLPNGPLAWH